MIEYAKEPATIFDFKFELIFLFDIRSIHLELYFLKVDMSKPFILLVLTCLFLLISRLSG